jgi:hypothetical protein
MDRVKQEPILALLLGLACVSGIVSALVGADVLLAVLGSLLVVVIWFIERQAARVGSRGSFNRAILVGLSGMVLRLGVAVGGLLVIALVDRPALASAAISFLATYTVYLFARLWRHPAITTTR